MSKQLDRQTVLAVLDLLRKKKDTVTRIGTPVAINKGKLIDELILEVDGLSPRPGYTRIPGQNGYQQDLKVVARCSGVVS